MSTDNISSSDASFVTMLRYLDSCKRHGVLPNKAVLSWLHKASVQKSSHKKCTVVVFLDELKDADLSPLIDAFPEFQHDAVNILCTSSCVLNQESILSLMRATSLKLQVVDLQHILFSKAIVRDLFQGGLNCHMLNLRFNEVEILKMDGRFRMLHTLNLDFCSSLTSMEKDCFAHMPNLMRLSMCGTRVTNLWTTSAALSRLTSLTELRFQNCMCCKDTGLCPAISGERRDFIHVTTGAYRLSDYAISGRDTGHSNYLADKDARRMTTCASKVTSETVGIAQNSDDLHGIGLLDLTSNVNPVSIKMTNPQIEVSRQLHAQEESESPTSVLKWDLTDSSFATKMYALQHPSPVCFERHYKEYMITTLPRLLVLDNLPVTQVEREMAKVVFSMFFEYLPYKRQYSESITSILHTRETGTSSTNHKKLSRTKQLSCHKSQIYYSRSLMAAKLGSSAWPIVLPMSHIGDMMKKGEKSLRPRQFEYHPSDSSLMAFGTLDGEVVVVNHEKGNILKYIPSFRTTDQAIGLCWLNKNPSKLLAGFDNGSLRLYDINQVPPKVKDRRCTSSTMIYDDFEQLTSVHVNATDNKLLASNYSRKVAIYDVCSGRQLQLFTDIHQEPINVAKFAHHSPHLLVTSSFDCDIKMWDLRQKPVQPCYTTSSSRGNVVVCFSPDDLYLLASAVDNEVRQFLAVDGRLQTRFEIVSTGSSHNYTRSYYMNGRDYIISGSCEESVVRICCSQTGRRLKDIYLEDRGRGSSFFVQSLRSDPFRHFNVAILAASTRPSSPWEIIKVNLLASSHCQGTSEC